MLFISIYEATQLNIRPCITSAVPTVAVIDAIAQSYQDTWCMMTEWIKLLTNALKSLHRPLISHNENRASLEHLTSTASSRYDERRSALSPLHLFCTQATVTQHRQYMCNCF